MMSCNSFNVICVVICSGCLEEDIGETGAGKTWLRVWFRLCRQHIKQPQHEQLKVFSFYPDVLSLTCTFHITTWGRKVIFNSFLPLHRQIYIIWAITADSSPLDIASDWAQTGWGTCKNLCNRFS